MPFSFIFYLSCTPVSPVAFVTITSFVILTGIVTLAPESTPSIVKVVSNTLFVPNNDVLLIAVKDKDCPLIVSLRADCVNGLAVLDFPLAPTPTACVNNLLSANVKKYPPGSFKFDKPEKFKVVGLTVVVAPNDNCTADILELLEPYCNQVYLKEDKLFQPYLDKEQPNCKYDLGAKLVTLDITPFNDVIIHFDARQLNNDNYQKIFLNFPRILEESGEPNASFELDIFAIKIKTLDNQVDTLVNSVCK